MDVMAWLGIVGGLVVLVGGAEVLVRGASGLALRFGISPLVIGLTVVAFGTSAPELAVSIQSGLSGRDDIALGNVVGSNIFNVLAVLGVAALITPLVVQQQLVRFDVPLVIGLSLLLLVMASDGRIGRFDGLLLASGLVVYTVFTIRQSRRESAEIRNEYERQFGVASAGPFKKMLLQVAFILAGLALLVLGAHWLVNGAVSIARSLEVSDVVIGLTIVAAGTSFPELATSVVAAARGERDIAVGNVIGSSIFNLLGIVGIASLVTPGGLAAAPSLVQLDIPVMIAVAFACLPIFAAGHRIDRWEGVLFLGYYTAYVTYLVLAATQQPALKPFSTVMLAFVLPLTAVTLLLRWARHRSGSASAG